MSAVAKRALRATVTLLGALALLAALVGGWLLLRPLGLVYALAGAGAIGSLLFGAGYAARGSPFGRWLMED